jgi:hypothetical protein
MVCRTKINVAKTNRTRNQLYRLNEFPFCSVTDNDLPSNSQFLSQDDVVKVTRIWETMYSAFAQIFYVFLETSRAFCKAGAINFPGLEQDISQLKTRRFVSPDS